GGSSGSSGSGDSSDSSDSSSSGDWAGALAAAALEAYIETVHRLYTRYPYADGSKGFVLVVDPDDDDPPGQRLSGTLSVDGGYFGPTLGRAGLDFELMVRRFGLALDAAPHLEIDPVDALTLGSAAFMIAPVLRPRWQVYAGIGLGFMIDGRTVPQQERVDVVGVNGTVRTTVLPVRPLVLRGRFDVGRLGAAPTLLGRVTAGVMVRRLELFGGYEARKVGRVLALGPTAGVRLWF
ncbi:MAG: hypothetical protein KDK70_28415, partial [Myxococcales bacterium]|nr:hypothetical protein [Myxococcales bacterium]